jgi:pSer/pThr/pTyr-binding forkhead associated (FHA) protein
MTAEQVLAARMQPAAASASQRLALVLDPVGEAVPGPIRIDDSLFAIGRAEPPFAAYPPSLVAGLSRRHARLFVEGDTAYLADLGSKNGTTLNGKRIEQAIVPLADGDLLELAGTLAYRVHVQGSGTALAAPPARLASLTLEPVHPERGVEPIVVSRFPFLISKVDPAFARYLDGVPEQVGYLSRRHAHIFLKAGRPFVEDLGSTNGTCIGAVRLDERAQELQEGDELAFGGHHFVYRVRLQWEQSAPEPTATRIGMARPEAGAGERADGAGAADKTTFVNAAGSFLDIFCVEQVAQAEGDAAPAPSHGAASAGAPGAQGRRVTLVAASLLEALGGAGEAARARLLRALAAMAALAVLAALLLYRAGATERALEGLIAEGHYERAALLAAGHLARDPGDAEIRALSTEALLKADLPRWCADLRLRRFDRAAAALARMRAASRDNADAGPLVAEIAWINALEQFVAGRGGADVPVRDGADAARIRQFLKAWRDDQQAHQRAAATLSATVPAFRDTYARAVSDLRKLELAGGGNGNDQ